MKEPSGTFRVKSTFDLKSGGMFLIVGDVVTGLARVGDRPSTGHVAFTVAAVEMLTHSDGRCEVALGIRCADAARLSQRENLAFTRGLDLGHLPDP